MVDQKLIKQVKAINSLHRVFDFKLYDSSGNLASQSKRPYSIVDIIFVDGRTIRVDRETFEAFGEYKFKLAVGVNN